MAPPEFGRLHLILSQPEKADYAPSPLVIAPLNFQTLLQILAKRREKLLGVTPIPKFIGSTTLAYHTQTYV